MPLRNDLYDDHDQERQRPRHARTHSEPLPALVAHHHPKPRPRKLSMTPTTHPLLRISTASRAAASVTDLTRILSPSLASFTPADAPAYESLRGLPFAASMQAPRPKKQRPTLFSIITNPGQSTPVNGTKPSIISTSSPVCPPSPPRSRSPTPPPSPTMSIPSISRTHSSAVSSSLPATPPLPLSPLSLDSSPGRRRMTTSPPPSKVFTYTTTPRFKRERAPSLPVPVSPRNAKSRYPPSPATTPTSTPGSPSPLRPAGPGPGTLRCYPPPLSGRFSRERTTSLPLQPSSSCQSNKNVLSPSPPSPLHSLHSLETHSKLMRFTSTCAVCGVPGADFPRCPRCGDAWCSRKCRAAAAAAAGGADGGGSAPRGHGCRALGRDMGAGAGVRTRNSSVNDKPKGGSGREHVRVVVVGRRQLN